MEISNIFVSPVKSFQQIEVGKADLTSLGLKNDHIFALAVKKRSQKGSFYEAASQKNFSDLAKGTVKIEEKHITMHHPNAGEIMLPILKNLNWSPHVLDFIVTGRKCIAQILGEDLSQIHIKKWAEDVLQSKNAYLASAMPLETALQSKYWNNIPENALRFHDGAPLHVTFEETRKELEVLLQEFLDIRRFRPQIHFSGSKPQLYKQKIIAGNAEIGVLNPTIRCKMVDIHQNNDISGLLYEKSALELLQKAFNEDIIANAQVFDVFSARNNVNLVSSPQKKGGFFGMNAYVLRSGTISVH